ncbi:disease resistance protein RPP13-like [Hordeum vulgare]|nr:disease resistance protein RPP13-like [Hordeum vulgare]
MEIAVGAIGSFLPKLTNLLVGEFTLQGAARKAIESLINDLTLMRAALCKLTKVPPEQLHQEVKIWVADIRSFCNQMEDIVDALLVRLEEDGGPVKAKNRVNKLIHKTRRLIRQGKCLHQIAGALEEAIHQARQIVELGQRYEQEVTHDVIELIGIQHSRDKLINILTEDGDCSKHLLKTVSIVGFGGLGKTTLAKAAYDKIKGQFDSGAFVPVSQNPDMKKVFKNILFDLDKNKHADNYNKAHDVRELIEEIIQFLNDKKYASVILLWIGSLISSNETMEPFALVHIKTFQ